MGVHGTFCQLCGLPTQHDHYVRTRSGPLKIYRGLLPDGGHTWEGDERPFRFGAEHVWLKDAVVLPWDEERVLRGAIEDGALEDVMVFEGGDDGLAFHHACWELQGSPGSTGPAVRANGSHGWSLVEGYHEQLFDFEGLEADGNAWMLADPRQDVRSRQRIEDLLAIARVEVTAPAEDIAGILSLDRDWAGMNVRDDAGERRAVVRARTYAIENVDKTGYSDLVRIAVPYDGGASSLPMAPRMQQLQAFETALKRAVESDQQAVLALVAIAQGRAEFLCWARSGASTKEVASRVPIDGGANIDVRRQPDWSAAIETLARIRSR